MNLKKIKLFGFKSFAEKTELSFESGVTAIVGPNGVGKSNIAEAIRWVLGEQNARELRGLKMEDVIFNGTQTRSPLNFSEVSLVFQNNKKILPVDYDEVVITRRIFRTGESQYLLNKTVVRLKDINDLLLGTGVGLDSYSIIGQGKIDLILSSKPEDRRYIFEEAAGITKYKSKKKEALRKLEHTENNLLRINDITKEVSRQISSIERQVKKAKKYQERFEQLKEKDLKVGTLLYKKLKNTLNLHSGEGEKFNENKKLLLEEIEKVNLLLSEGKQKSSEIEEKLNISFSRKVNIDAQIEGANQHTQLNIERISELQNRKENLEKQIQSTEIRLQEASEQTSKAKNELAALKKDELNKTETSSQKTQHLKDVSSEIEEMEKNIKNCKENIFEVSSLESRNNNELAKISAEETNIKSRFRRIKIEKEEIGESLKKIEENFSSINAKKDEKNQKTDSLKKQKDLALYNANLRAQALGEIKNQLTQLNQQAIAFQSKLEYLNDLKKKFEGYQNGVKSILMARDENQLPRDGIFGAIANLIEVERGREKAVAAALGEKAQILVVRDETTLNKCINYLKDNNKGKATFICLETISNTACLLNSELKPLLSAINCGAEFKNAVAFLFADTYLVKSMGDALDIRKKTIDEKIKLVSEDGDVIESNLITCGITNLQETSLIGRQAKIKILEENIIECNYEKENLNSAKEKEEMELKNFNITLENLDSTLRKEELALADLSSRLKAIEKKAT